jgi:hypothetical protein
MIDSRRSAAAVIPDGLREYLLRMCINHNIKSPTTLIIVLHFVWRSSWSPTCICSTDVADVVDSLMLQGCPSGGIPADRSKYSIYNDRLISSGFGQNYNLAYDMCHLSTYLPTSLHKRWNSRPLTVNRNGAPSFHRIIGVVRYTRCTRMLLTKSSSCSHQCRLHTGG